MNDLYQEFLHHIADECFPSGVQTRNPRERAFLTLRFYPDNREKRHLDIAKDMRQILPEGDYLNTIGTTCQNVVRAITNCYKSEMEADGQGTHPLLNGKQGQGGAWEKVYIWLETKKFPRWQTEYIWRQWRERPRANVNWISFHYSTLDRGMVVPKPSVVNSQIEINKSLIMQIEIADDGYLLLLNRGLNLEGLESRYVITPSAAFAPQIQAVASLKYLPQAGAMSNDIQFDSVGREEYIGILVDRPTLDRLSWLHPNQQEPVPTWDEDRLYQIWLELEHQPDRAVYYQSFDVVNSAI